MKYFGTDGIRGIVGKKIDEKLLKKVARALVRYYTQHKLPKNLLVASDGRQTGDYIFATIISVLLKHGFDVHYIGVCSSPCLAYTTQQNNFPLGMMISASHNPSEYNGIKFFNCLGEKISEKTELELENGMEKRISCTKTYGKLFFCKNLTQNYVEHLKSLLPKQNLNQNIIIDCAFGGASQIVKQLFKCKIINCQPNGQNINENAGCLHPEMLISLCKQNNALGFALDGDGDRLTIISPTGEIIAGDKMLYILANHFLKENDFVVGTIYTNEGLCKSLLKNKIKVVRAGVGDKLVYEKMIEYNAILGGENSGHIIIKNHLNTGDAVACAIIILNILARCKCDINHLLNGYEQDYMLEKSLPINKHTTLSATTLKIIEKAKQSGCRVVVRASGTESVLRVMVEHELKHIAEFWLENIVKTLP